MLHLINMNLQLVHLGYGSVGPFGLLSNNSSMVKYFFDEKTFEKYNYFAFPANSSSCTIVIHKEDFVTLIKETPSICNNKINFKNFEQPSLNEVT